MSETTSTKMTNLCSVCGLSCSHWLILLQSDAGRNLYRNNNIHIDICGKQMLFLNKTEHTILNINLMNLSEFILCDN